jgi:hypothetical protein
LARFASGASAGPLRFVRTGIVTSDSPKIFCGNDFLFHNRPVR